MRTPADEPWIAKLPAALYARLFPRGALDVADYLEELDELEAAGYPMKCTDPETLLDLVQICRESDENTENEDESDENTANEDAVYSFEGKVLAVRLARVMQLCGAKVGGAEVLSALTACGLRLTGTTAEEAISRTRAITENRVCPRCGKPQRRLKAEHGAGWYHGNDYSDIYIRRC